jgi:hypothetical protein
MRPMGVAGQPSHGPLIACASTGVLEQMARHAPHRLDSALDKHTPKECWEMMAPLGKPMPEGWLRDGRWR